MATYHLFEMEAGVCLTFTNVSVLTKWLDEKREGCGSPEAFCEWLQNYFDNGNEISVHGKQYDYWACWELV